MLLPQFVWQSFLLPLRSWCGLKSWERTIAPSGLPPDFTLLGLQPKQNRDHARVIAMVAASAALYAALSFIAVAGLDVIFHDEARYERLVKNVFRCIGAAITLWVVVALAFSAPSAVLLSAVAIPLGVVVAVAGAASKHHILEQAWCSLAVSTGTALALSHYSLTAWAPRHLNRSAEPGWVLSAAHRGMYLALITGYAFVVAAMTQADWFISTPFNLSWPIALALCTLLVGAAGWMLPTGSEDPARLWSIYWKLIVALSTPFILLALYRASEPTPEHGDVFSSLGEGLALGVVFASVLAVSRAFEVQLCGRPGVQVFSMLLSAIAAIAAVVYHLPLMQSKVYFVISLAVVSFGAWGLLVLRGRWHEPKAASCASV